MKNRVALNLRFLIWSGLACLIWTGCATAPPQVELPASLDIPRAIELKEVPFHPQGEYQCGPASLAMTLEWSGVAITPDQLKPEVYTPSRQGSLPPDMIGAARRHGRVAYPVHRIEDVLKEVTAGHPVIVLQRLRSLFRSSWHYAVVIGYDLDQRQIILHSGVEAREVLTLEEFAETWQDWGHWGLLTLAPQDFPATVREDVYLKAVIGLEQTERWNEAGQAYARAAERWPHNKTAWIGLGNSRYTLGNLAEAEQAFRSAVDAAPQSGAAHNNLAHVLMELDRQEEALEAINRAIQLGGPLAEVFQKTRTEIQQRMGS
ncbi:MAG: PA2778 family cysteine peptidase [Nitrospinota bacterium]|nr:PA2778 family cysteine peptidase [Nitrospinota bacterium]